MARSRSDHELAGTGGGQAVDSWSDSGVDEDRPNGIDRRADGLAGSIEALPGATDRLQEGRQSVVIPQHDEISHLVRRHVANPGALQRRVAIHLKLAAQRLACRVVASSLNQHPARREARPGHHETPAAIDGDLRIRLIFGRVLIDLELASQGLVVRIEALAENAGAVTVLAVALPDHDELAGPLRRHLAARLLSRGEGVDLKLRTQELGRSSVRRGSEGEECREDQARRPTPQV